MGAAFDGDPEWRKTETLEDGTVVTLRPIFPSDKDELKRAFLESSGRTRYFRFMGYASEPTDAMLSYLCDVDQKNHVAIVATIASNDLKTEEGVGVARFVRLRDEPEVAEAAVTVRDDMQGRGIGKVLMRALQASAIAHGIRTIRAEVLADNDAMRALLREAGARVVAEDPDSGTIAYDVDLPADPDKTLLEILRTAAQTMGLRLRRLFPSGTFATDAGEREGGEGGERS